MKYFLLFLLIVFAIYLNRSYNYFYNYFDKNFIAAPVWTLPDPQSKNPKFITLGDSLFVGVGASSEQTSLSYLLFKSKYPDGSADLINLAVPGAKIRDVLVGQLPTALKSNPKEVVIFIGINDMHDRTSLDTFEKDYRELITELTSQTYAKVTLINIPYLGSNVILWPPWNYYMDIKTGLYNQVIKRLAKENNLEMIDLYTLSKNEFTKSSDLYSKDQFHPSDQGYILWVNLIESAKTP